MYQLYWERELYYHIHWDYWCNKTVVVTILVPDGIEWNKEKIEMANNYLLRALAHPPAKLTVFMSLLQKRLAKII
ncbi:hypothetical protein [Photorhabdus laumondii]|uniref:hypothetical protein n=1 Tax=Photorhabdus laumondii TaxID=2218628 RepID=UPI0025AF02B2|nr:hypothetical protein [Photorhabdus laumondii]